MEGLMNPSPVTSTLIRPLRSAGTLRRDLVHVMTGAAALTVSARISLPISPVPISAQSFAVLMLGAMLGARRASASVLAYLAAGAMGAPVFVAGGGLSYLLGPTAGYLWGFLPAAWLLGELADRGWTRCQRRCLTMLLLAEAVLFSFGLAWLALYVPASRLLVAGLWPFLPGETLKVLLAATLIYRPRF